MNEVTDPSDVLQLKIVGKNLTHDDRSRLFQDLKDRDIFDKVDVPLKTDPSVVTTVMLVCSLICAAAVLPDAIKNVQKAIRVIDKKSKELWIEFQGMKIDLDRKVEDIVEEIRAILRCDEEHNDE